MRSRGRIAALAALALIGSLAVGVAPVAAATQVKTISQSFAGTSSPNVDFTVTGVCDDCVDDGVANAFNSSSGSWAFGADSDAHVATVDYASSTSTSVSYDDVQLKQGQSVVATDVLTASAGTITAKGTLTGHWGFYHDPLGGDDFQPDGTLTPFSKPFTAVFPCAMPLPGDPPATCTSGLISQDIASIDVFDIGINYIAIDFKVGLRLDVTLNGAGVATVRSAVVSGGGSNQTAPLSFGGTSPSTLVDPVHISCAEPAGNDLSYGFTGTSYGPTTSLGSSIEIDVDADLHQRVPFPPFDFVFVTLFGGPVKTVDTPDADLALPITAPDKSVVLGTIAKNNIPPVVDAGPSPYSGDQGSPIQFDGSGSSSVCGFPTLRWDFSDGGVAFGKSPTHTFKGSGTYSGQLTATDATGLVSTTTFSVDVNNLPPVVSAGPDTTAAWGRQVAFNGSAVDPGADDQATLTYSWSFGDGSPSATGGPSTLHAYSVPGDYTATLTVCDLHIACSTDSRVVHVRKRTVSIGYLGDTAGTFDTQGNLSASLVDEFGSSINGRTLSFTVGGGAAGSGVTNSSGIGGTAFTPLLDAGSYTTTASFAGDSLYEGSSGNGSIAIARKATSVAYTGALNGGPNKTVTLSAILTDATAKQLAGRVIVFQLGTQTVSATTNGSGIASTSLKLSQKNGIYPLTATWTPAGGDADHYAGSSASVSFKLQAK